MAEWRVARGWSDEELELRLQRLPRLQRNFGGSHGAGLEHPAWRTHVSRSLSGRGPEGPPTEDGPFARCRSGIAEYAFSDPDIVEAHYASGTPLEDRFMLLELKPGPLHYLCGVVVGRVRDEKSPDRTTFGFRYDTLEGHIESGFEWFLLEKEHVTGRITFRIEATWRRGDFPNWWSRLGFALVGARYQRRWHVTAHHRMAAILRGTPPSSLPSLHGGTGQGPEVTFSIGSPASMEIHDE